MKTNFYVKKDKGITLIALVVTIVVLLILATVSISMLGGESGIIAHVSNAKNETEQAKVEELVSVAIGSLIAENQGDRSVITPSIIAQEINRIENRADVKSEGDAFPTNILFEKEGRKVGVDINISVTSPQEQELKTLSDLEVGNYLIYDSGIYGELIFRVLYEQSSEYGLQIISNQSLEEVELGSTQGLTEDETIALIDELKEVAEKYLNTLYASDARCVGTHPLNGSDYEFNSETYKIDFEQMVNNNISKITTNYWIASIIKEVPWTTTYSVLNITTEGEVEKVPLCAVTPYGTNAMATTEIRGFRPCITLKETLKVVSGDGKSEKTAYKLVEE